jgi:hypothetical protein
MHLLRRSIMLATSILLLSDNASLGAPRCQPRLSFKTVQLSPLRNMERKWSAVLDVDASRCAATSGRFDIYFLREKENAPELDFTEPFTWHTDEMGTGQIEVSIDFWMDEAVLDYAIGRVVPCACRE